MHSLLTFKAKELIQSAFTITNHIPFVNSLDRHQEVKAIVCVNISQIRITMSKDFFKDQLNQVDFILLIL